MTQQPTVIYEDDDVLVINKPAGLVVHGDGNTKETSVCDWLMEAYPEIKGVGEPMTLQDGTVMDRPGIVHRLDRDTSGVMIVAKTQKAFLHLKEQFQERHAEKIYRAFVYGVMKKDEETIERSIARSKKDFRLWSAQRFSRGTQREAVTEYKVLKRGEEATYVEVYPKTGRTHQIRVHMKAINHSVVADSLYAPKREKILGFERLALHAYTLNIGLPSGETKEFEAPLPNDFLKAEEML